MRSDRTGANPNRTGANPNRTGANPNRTWLAGLAIGAALFGVSAEASAFCRTTTCDPGDPAQGCEVDGNGCVVSGIPLAWPQLCVTFSVHEAGTPLRGLDYDSSQQIIATAFQTWMDADCGGVAPSIILQSRGPVQCDKQEYNQDQPNANILVFRDEEWPYPDSSATLALTTITFNVETGEIFDSDIEINSADVPLTTGNRTVEADLLSIVTHETGHFLGLSHTRDNEATMFAQYAFGDTGLRSLAADDIAGICDIYPPERATEACNFDARHGFSPACATEVTRDTGCCTVAPGQQQDGSRGTGALVLALLGLCGAGWRRREAQLRTDERRVS